MRCCGWAFIDDVDGCLNKLPEAAPSGAVFRHNALGDPQALRRNIFKDPAEVHHAKKGPIEHIRQAAI